MQNNRGHKLDSKECPPTTRTILPILDYPNERETGICKIVDSSITSILSSSEAIAHALQIPLKGEDVEEDFLIYCKLHSSNKELSFTEVRLLYYGFIHSSSSCSNRREAFKMPKRISESLGMMSVRDALAAGPLIQLEKALMSLVEDYHNRMVISFSRLLSLLDIFLLEDVEKNNNGNKFLPIIALLRNQIMISQQYKDLLMECRSGIIKAKDYGHLIGRFLIGREERKKGRKI